MSRSSKYVALNLNPGDPEAAGLSACIVAVPGGMLDLVKGVYGVRSGTADPSRSSELGTLDAYFDGNADQHIVATDTIADVSQPFTIVWEAQLDSHIDAYPMLAHFQRGVLNEPLRCFYSSDPSYSDVTVAYGIGNSLRFAMPSGVSRTGERHWGMWSYLGGTFATTSNHLCVVNGQVCSVSTSNSVAAITDSTRVGGSTNAGTDWNGGIRQVRFYSRAWSEADARRFYDPATRDSLFSRPRRRIFLGVTAGGGPAEGSGTGSATTGGEGTGYALHSGAGTGTAASGGAGAGYVLHYGNGTGTAASGGVGEGLAPTVGVAEGSGVGTAASGGAGVGYVLHYGHGTGTAATSGAGDGLAPSTTADGSGVGTAVTGGAGTGYVLHYGSGVGSAVTGGAGASASQSLTGRSTRRGRRPLWLVEDSKKKVSPEALREAAAYVESLVGDASLYDLQEEQRILRDALELATAKQRKAVSTMIEKIERRMVEIEEDEAAIVLLM